MANKERQYSCADLKRARRRVDDYRGAKLRIIAYPKKRPTFLKQMKIDLSDYPMSGQVRYDQTLASRLDIDDWFFLSQYVEDMETVWIVDHAIEAQHDEKTRRIAEETIKNGKKCSELVEKYGLKERTIRWHKEKIVRWIASVLP